MAGVPETELNDIIGTDQSTQVSQRSWITMKTPSKTFNIIIICTFSKRTNISITHYFL